jgi:uncharacterized glyoxalase superfamily protein PhnB
VKLKEVRPVLYVVNMDETIRFYCELLGFACLNRTDGWAALRNDYVEIMISLPNAHIPFEKPLFTGSLYFHTGDVDGCWQRLKDKTTIVYPIENFDYGMREFAIRDNNGYCLQFGQEIKDKSQIPPRDED